MPSLTSGNLIGSSVRPVVSQARFSQARPVRQSVSQAWIFSGNLTVGITVYDHLKPGRWVEFQECEAWVRSDDDSMARAPSVQEWQEKIDEASIRFGKRMNVAETLKDYMIQAGFQNVQDDPYKVRFTLHPLP